MQQAKCKEWTFLISLEFINRLEMSIIVWKKTGALVRKEVQQNLKQNKESSPAHKDEKLWVFG